MNQSLFLLVLLLAALCIHETVSQYLSYGYGYPYYSNYYGYGGYYPYYNYYGYNSYYPYLYGKK